MLEERAEGLKSVRVIFLYHRDVLEVERQVGREGAVTSSRPSPDEGNL